MDTFVRKRGILLFLCLVGGLILSLLAGAWVSAEYRLTDGLILRGRSFFDGDGITEAFFRAAEKCIPVFICTAVLFFLTDCIFFLPCALFLVVLRGFISGLFIPSAPGGGDLLALGLFFCLTLLFALLAAATAVVRATGVGRYPVLRYYTLRAVLFSGICVTGELVLSLIL